MQTIRTYKYRLYPSKQQENILLNQLRITCNLYNHLLEKKKAEYEFGKNLSEFDLNNYISQLKQENSELKQVHSQILQQQSRRITNAFKNFFRRLKNREKPGFPRFKPIDRFRSLTFPQSGFSIENSKLRVFKVGLVNIRLHRQMGGKTLTMTIKRTQSGKWFAYFVCKLEIAPKPISNSKKVGIDLGLTHFATLSDGIHISNPHFLNRTELKLKEAQRDLSKRKKGSKNRNKQRIKLATIFEKLTNQRNDFAHRMSRQLVNEFSFLAIEKLQVMNISKKSKLHLSKHINDASWSNFIFMLCYKAEEAGSEVIEVDAKNTSQICSHCGFHVEKKLQVRIHRCENCGLELDRDHNAAINILNRALNTHTRDRSGTDRINACGDVPVGTFKKQEATKFI